MPSVKSLFKWPRNSCQILLLLTVLLATFYMIQTSHLLTVAKAKHGMNKEKNDRARVGNFPFSKNPNKRLFEGEKLIHLDLKGAPPKVTYFFDFLPFIKRMGATGILIEYEDMFPYKDGLDDIPAFNAYTPSEIADIIRTAEMNNLTVIPLIPTFSHFEFVLKLEKYKEYREVENTPQILCPSKRSVYIILKKMIDQVLEVHNSSKYLHIGCDEAEFLGVCSSCSELIREKKWRRDHIYFSHVKEIAEYITKNYPGVKPIVWGDKFVGENEKIILSFGIPQLVEVMLWNYRPEKSSFPPKNDMIVLQKMFKNIWIANAFKGATGSTQMVTNIDYHIENSKGWMDLVSEWKTMINFKGIALTGWQRYNHFTVLCELLPVGIPSLALNLQYLNSKTKEVFDYEVQQQCLQCNNIVPINSHDLQNLMLLSNLKCKFPGFRVYHVIHSFYNVLIRLASSLASLQTNDFLFYNIVNNASNPRYVHELRVETYERHLLELDDYREEIRDAMEEVYDDHTINEWIMTYLVPAKMRLEAAINILDAFSNMNVWPRRPFVNVEAKAQKLFNTICTRNATMGCAFLTSFEPHVKI